MKTSNVYLFLLIFLIGQLMISCTIFEPTTVTCPEFKSQKKEPAFEFKYLKQFPTRKRSFERTVPGFAINEQQKVEKVQRIQVKNKKLGNEAKVSSLPSEFVSFSKGSYLPPTFTRKTPGMVRLIKNKNAYKIQDKVVTDSCDLIVLLNGEEIRAKHLEIGSDSIKYMLCDRMESPFRWVSKSVVLKIKFTDGNEVNINSDLNLKQNTQKKAFGNSGIIGLLISIIGLILLIISLIYLSAGYLKLLFFFITLVGIGFGIKGLLNGVKNKPKDQTVRDKKETYAIIAILIGIIPIALLVLFIIAVIGMFLEHY